MIQKYAYVLMLWKLGVRVKGRKGVSMRKAKERLSNKADSYRRIYQVARQIPAGQVASFGQIALVSSAPSSHVVGHAIAEVPGDSPVPWHRVVNSDGTISVRRRGMGEIEQRRRLMAEGVTFNERGRVDFKLVGWTGPAWQWLESEGFDVDHLVLKSGQIRRRGPWVRWSL